MPQYDPDPYVLSERCYTMATDYILVDGSYEAWEEVSAHDLKVFRESIRTLLLDEFPDLDGNIVADEMDQALYQFGFPFERAT